jgi:hypothetical protein
MNICRTYSDAALAGIVRDLSRPDRHWRDKWAERLEEAKAETARRKLYQLKK